MVKRVLVDAGFFIGRQGRWWSPKGSVRRAWNRWQRSGSKPDFFKFQAAMRKAIRNDVSYLNFRIRQAGFGKAESITICYDGVEGCATRIGIFPQYKQNRREANEDGSPSTTIPDIRATFVDLGFNPDAMAVGWEAVYDESKEADDLIAEMVVAAKKSDELLVMTSDSDLFQCWNLHPKVRIHNFVEEIHKKDVEKKLGIPLSLYADWKAIAGDATDNIPGVPNLGGTAAATLLKNHKGLEYIPDEYLTTVVISAPDKVSESLTTYRAENELSMAATVREHGDYWRRVEKGQSLALRGEQYATMAPHINTGHVIVSNHKESCLKYKRIIKLPIHSV